MNTQPHKHADQIKAWADGAQIEFLTNSGEWKYVECPSWCEEHQYRVKPESAYPETTIDVADLNDIFDNTAGMDSALIAVANAAIKHFITSGMLDKYIKERNEQ